MFPGAPVPTTLRERLSALAHLVAGYVGDRTRPGPVHVRGPGLIPLAFCTLVQEWLFVRQRAMSHVIWLMETGRWRAPRVRAARTVRADGSAALVSPTRPAPPAEQVLPRGLGWLCRWAPEVSHGGAQIAALLEEPELKEKVLAAPARMVRLIGPILTATGQRRPAWFPKAPTRARRQSTPAAFDRERRASAPRSAWVAPPFLPEWPRPPVCPPPPAPSPRMAPWTGRGPGLCATLAEYRSPYEPPGGENPRVPPLPPDGPPDGPEWRRRMLSKTRRSVLWYFCAYFVTISK